MKTGHNVFETLRAPFSVGTARPQGDGRRTLYVRDARDVCVVDDLPDAVSAQVIADQLNVADRVQQQQLRERVEAQVRRHCGATR